MQFVSFDIPICPGASFKLLELLVLVAVPDVDNNAVAEEGDDEEEHASTPS